MRFAYARINQETNALSPVTTEMADFARTHLVEGDLLALACQSGQVEARGFMNNAELSGFVKETTALPDVTLVPLVSAWAVPSGPLSLACFEDVVARITEPLSRGLPVDGVYLCLHGAMGVHGILEPEGEIIRRVRAIVGPLVPIVVTFDLHGNVTRDVMNGCDALIAYATNPHRDHASTGRKAARLLHRMCRSRSRITVAWRSLPMLLGGGTTIDFLQPVRSIFSRMRNLERRGDVLSASMLMAHPWNAHPELGWSVVVVTDNDQEGAERFADELAEKCWAVRHALPPHFVTPKEAIESARRARIRRKLGAVVLADASDVVTAGAPGESTRLLEALVLHAQGLVCHVPLRDPVAVEELWARNASMLSRISPPLLSRNGPPCDQRSASARLNVGA